MEVFEDLGDDQGGVVPGPVQEGGGSPGLPPHPGHVHAGSAVFPLDCDFSVTRIGRFCNSVMIPPAA